MTEVVRRWGRVIGPAALAAAVLASAACSSGDRPSTASAPPATTAAPTSTPTSTPMATTTTTSPKPVAVPVAPTDTVYAHGDAVYVGSPGPAALSRPIVAMAAAPSASGYWLAGADGGVFAYGDAPYLGSAGASAQPVVGIVGTPSGRGYWLVARDGGVFSFGDAGFYGSATDVRGGRPVVAMSRSRSGQGYWMVTDDGGVFSFGDAAFLGAHGPPGASGRVVAMAATATGQGYWLATAGNLAAPVDLVPLLVSAGPDEGHWSPAGRAVGDRPVAWTTTLRPSGQVPAVSIALLDQSRLRTVVYAGYDQPSGQWSASTVIDPSLRPQLVAAFNGGFRLDASRGGFYSDGRAAIGLRDGAASLVVRADGTATVGMWGRDATLTPEVVQVRQNLDLLVDGGRPVPAAAGVGPWGATLGNVAFTWRSGVGVDDTGHLIYAAGPGLDAQNLAQALVGAGAVTAMELDINPQWPLFVSYDGGPDPSAVGGTKLRGDMNYPAGHYFASNERDFVAVFAR